MMELKPPGSYADWVQLLTRLKNKENDALVLAAMKKGNLAWQAGVADRFVNKLMDAVNGRLNRAVDAFQLEVKRAGQREGDIARALLALRKELRFLADAADIPALPEKERAEIRRLIVEQAKSIETSLEQSARASRSGGGRLLEIIRKNRVDCF